MVSFAQTLYNAIFRKNAMYLATVFAGAFAFELTFDRTMDRIWDSANKGRQWKDIKHKYMESD